MFSSGYWGFGGLSINFELRFNFRTEESILSMRASISRIFQDVCYSYVGSEDYVESAESSESCPTIYLTRDHIDLLGRCASTSTIKILLWSAQIRGGKEHLTRLI